MFDGAWVIPVPMEMPLPLSSYQVNVPPEPAVAVMLANVAPWQYVALLPAVGAAGVALMVMLTDELSDVHAPTVSVT